jgi:predicted nucleic acid-binding protein
VKSWVLDASVAAKWFLPSAQETLTDEAQRLLEDFAKGRVRFLAPDLFWPEFGNVLWKAVRLGRISRETAEVALATLEEAKITTAPASSLLKDSFAIAVTFGRSVYDCTYVALAVASNTTFLTADERLANVLAARFPVRWLGSL